MPKQLSLQKNISWAFFGNLTYQASQWLNLVMMAKLLDVADVGRFALALAICTPITTFASLNLRSVQVTDAKDEHRFGHFLGVQLLTALIAMLIISAIAAGSGYEASTAWLIVVVGLGQAVITTRGVFIGFNQKHERMDTVAASTAVLGFGSLAALGLTLWVTRNLLLGVIAMQSAKLAVLLLWDIRATSRLVRLYVVEAPATYLMPIFSPRIMLGLAWLALPLGISSLLLSVYNNVPRYLIAYFLGKESLGYFAAIMALVMAGMMVTQAAGTSALPRLSHYYLTNHRAYMRLLSKLMLTGTVLGLLGLLIVFVWGRPILAIVFTSDYAAYNNLFVWSMIFGLIAYVVTFLGYGLTSMRFFVAQPVPNTGAVLVAILFGFVLISEYGIVAAVWSLIAGKFVQGFTTLIMIALKLKPSLAAMKSSSPTHAQGG